MKLTDVRLRGCAYTLFPAAEAAGVDVEKVHRLLLLSNLVAYTPLKKDENGNVIEDDSNIDLPTSFTLDDIKDNLEYLYLEEFEGIVSKFEGLVEKDGETFSFTPKMLEILENAAAKQKELDAKNFHSFGCCHHCF